MKATDSQYVGLPWRAGGRTRAGLDCVGLVMVFLLEEYGLAFAAPDSRNEGAAERFLAGRKFDATALQRGDVVFFARPDGLISHVGIWLGDGKLLHIVRGIDSRVENGFELLSRARLYPVASCGPGEAETLAAALADARLGDPGTLVLIVVAVALAVASYALTPKLSRNGNKYGRYGFDSLITQTSTEIPLPDILGEVVVAGNSPYTQLSDKNLSATASQQRANKIVILSAGPCELVDYEGFGITINGLTYSDKYFKNGSSVFGLFPNPAQSKDEAVSGTISADTYVPSFTIYDGAHGISVPVDVRADYDRTFPVYGFSGCSYLVFRLIDSTKFPSFNLTARVRGRKCRPFDSSGFVVSTSTAEAVGTGDSSTRRFKLDFEDIVAVSSLTVNGSAWSAGSETSQTGNVYFVNRLKGYIEFPANIPGAFAIVATYTYYARVWSQNPAMHLVYLLTESGRGKGFDASRVNWPAAVALRDYCDAAVTDYNSNGTITGVRYTSNYAVDFRKPIQEHIRAVLDCCHATLFVSDGKFVMKARRDGASVFSFTESNILADSFQSELADRAEKPNRIKAFFHSKTTYNAETESVREDVLDQLDREPRIGNAGVVEENLKFPAVDNQEQAERLAGLILREQVDGLWLCSFKTTVLGLAIEPGDVVDVTHGSQASWSAKLFRVESVSYGDDDRLELQLSEYTALAYA